MSTAGCLLILGCLWPSNTSLECICMLLTYLGSWQITLPPYVCLLPNKLPVLLLLAALCLEWEPGMQPNWAHTCAFLRRGSRKQGNSSNLRIKQCGWSGSDIWMHVNVLVQLEGSMQLLIPFSISTLWSCVTWGRGRSAILLKEQEGLSILTPHRLDSFCF